MPTSFEHANIVAGHSKIIAEKIYLGKNHKHIYNPYYIEIPYEIAHKFDLKDSDCLIWRYYHDKRAAIVTKREGWKSRRARLLLGQETGKMKKQTPSIAIYT